MITDPISNMLTQIRNALAIRKRELSLPYSNLKFNLAKALEKYGWIGQASAGGEGPAKLLKLQLKYDDNGEPTITGLSRISKPGQRIYAKAKLMPRSKLGQGVAIVTTSRGLMTSEEARKAKLGGELICEVW